MEADPQDRVSRLRLICDLYKSEYERLKQELSYQQKLHQTLHGLAKNQRRQLFIGVNPSKQDKPAVINKLVQLNHERISEFQQLVDFKNEFDKKITKIQKKLEKQQKPKLSKALIEVEQRKHFIEATENEFAQRKDRSIQRKRQNIIELQAGSIMNSSLTSFHSVKSLSRAPSYSSKSNQPSLNQSRKIKIVSSQSKLSVEPDKLTASFTETKKQESFRIQQKTSTQKIKLFNYDFQ